eukprot:scaffold5517_cov135-Cylindrotheca_fusiformis.AAC.45
MANVAGTHNSGEASVPTLKVMRLQKPELHMGKRHGRGECCTRVRYRRHSFPRPRGGWPTHFEGRSWIWERRWPQDPSKVLPISSVQSFDPQGKDF